MSRNFYAGVNAPPRERRTPPVKPQAVLGPPPKRTGSPSTMDFQFANPLGSDEFIGEVDGALKLLDGVEGVSGNSTTAKVTYWSNEVSEDAIRKQFADSGYPVK